MKSSARETFRFYIRHAKRHKRLAGLVLFGVTMAIGMEILAPLFYKQFFDTLTRDGAGVNPQVLIRILLSIATIHAIGWVGWRISTFSNNRFQAVVMAELSNTCFVYLQQHSYGFFTNRFVGALVRKVNRFVDAFEGVSDRILWDLFPLALKMSAIIAVLWYHYPIIGFTFLIWTILYMVLNYFLTLYKLKYDIQRAEIDSEATARLADTITNNANIKVFTALNDEVGWFKRLTERQRAIRLFAFDLDSYIWAAQEGSMVVVEFIIFYFAIQFWTQGALTLGGFVLIHVYLIQAFQRLWDFGRVIRSLYRHFADAEEMTGILNVPHEIQDKLSAQELAVTHGEIEFRDVTFSYAKTREVIKELNLAIAPREKVGLVGPSGAGKTTITALILRFHDVTEGGIFIDGQNTADVTQESLRRHIAYVPQDPLLFHRTLLENIRYGRREATDEEVLRAARLAHCDEFIERLDQGYNTFVGERGIKLSGGERQRVAIARAILKNAPILVLDEATSSLDSHSEAMIQDALHTLMKQKTAIVIAHRLSTIMNMDRIVVLRAGQVFETGTHEGLLQKPDGLYKKLWDLQAGGFVPDVVGKK